MNCGCQFLPEEKRVIECEACAKRRKASALVVPPPTDKDILDYLQRQHTLHRAVEVLYVVDGYEAVATYDGAPVSRTVHGTTYREALMKLMQVHDITHGNRNLLKEKQG